MGAKKAYQEALSKQGLSEEELREEIKTNLTVQACLEEELDLSSVTASDEEIQALYEKEAAESEKLPGLEEVRGQIEQMAVQQKKQQLISQFLQQLRKEADIEVLI